VALPPDTYSFDIGINDMNYEFQFSIRAGETNRNILNRLERLINNSRIGLNAEIIEGEEETSSLRIESQTTGNQEKTVCFPFPMKKQVKRPVWFPIWGWTIFPGLLPMHSSL
jgi:flagellar hook-associated protein 2